MQFSLWSGGKLRWTWAWVEWLVLGQALFKAYILHIPENTFLLEYSTENRTKSQDFYTKVAPRPESSLIGSRLFSDTTQNIRFRECYFCNGSLEWRSNLNSNVCNAARLTGIEEAWLVLSKQWLALLALYHCTYYINLYSFV